MMAENKIQFMFNTPLTGVNKETGKFDEETHRTLALPIRGEIMQIDGVSGCMIYRFGFYVEYYDEMTSEDVVVEAVKGIIATFGQKPVSSGYFPLRGEKTPAAFVEVQKKTKWRCKKVTAGTDSLVEYVTVEGKPNEFDDAAFNRKVKPLVESLGNFNGVLKVEVAMTSVGVTFDSRLTTFDKVESHIKATLTAARESESFFPHIQKNEDLKFTFQSWNVPSLGTEED